MNTPVGTDEGPLPLAGLRIGLSGAVPERETWGDIQDLDRLITRFVGQFAGMAFDLGADIVHGSHPSFTPLLIETAKQYCGDEGEKRLTLVRAETLGEPSRYARARMSKYANTTVSVLPGVMDMKFQNQRDAALTAMRLVLISQIDVLVAIGGKLHLDTGRPSGLLDEMTLARLRGVPCFPIAALGGGIQQASPEVLRQFAQGTKLQPEEFERLAVRSPDIDLTAGWLIAHLIKHRDEWGQHEFQAANTIGHVAAPERQRAWRNVSRVEIRADIVANALQELDPVRSAIKVGAADIVADLFNTRSEREPINSSFAELQHLLLNR